MSKFTDIMKNKSFSELYDYCENKNLSLGDNFDNNKEYVFTACPNDKSNKLIFNAILSEGKLVTHVTSSSLDTVDTVTYTYNNDNELFSKIKESIDTFLELSSDLNKIIDDHNNKSSNSLKSNLESIYNSIKDISNNYKKLKESSIDDSDISYILEGLSVTADTLSDNTKNLIDILS